MIDVAKKGAVHKVTFIETICGAMNETPSFSGRILLKNLSLVKWREANTLALFNIAN